MFRKGKYKKLEKFGTKTVFDVNMPRGIDKLHPTEKPTGFIEKILIDTTKSGDLIIDPFMGSGSTCMACVNTNRRFIGIELDDGYFNIAKKRIEDAVNDLP